MGSLTYDVLITQQGGGPCSADRKLRLREVDSLAHCDPAGKSGLSLHNAYDEVCDASSTQHLGSLPQPSEGCQPGNTRASLGQQGPFRGVCLWRPCDGQELLCFLPTPVMAQL